MMKAFKEARAGYTEWTENQEECAGSIQSRKRLFR